VSAIEPVFDEMDLQPGGTSLSVGNATDQAVATLLAGYEGESGSDSIAMNGADEDDTMEEEAFAMPIDPSPAEEDEHELDQNHTVKADVKEVEEPSVDKARHDKRAPDAPEPRVYPIEIVLSPILNPSEYIRLPPSWTVERVLDEIEVEGETWFSIEFDDGRVDQVSDFT
jgi:hypothetical protein